MKYNNENRTKNAKLTKQKIYESTEKLVLEYGYEDLTVDQIVEDAGIAKGSFYVHFISKDALYAEIVAQKTASADSNYQSFLNSLHGDMSSSQRLLALVGKIADELTDVIGYERIKIIYKALITGTVNKVNAMMGYNRQLYKSIESVVSQGLQSGEFCSKFSSETLAKQFLVSYRGLTFEWSARYPDFDLKANALEHFKIMIDGLNA